MSKQTTEKNSSDPLGPEERLKREFPGRLRGLREAAGQKQSQVAKALGFASETVYQLWEKEGGNLPNALNLHKLATYFHVSTDYLLGLQEEQVGLAVPAKQSDDRAQREVLRLAVLGKGYDAPELLPLLSNLRRSRLEKLEACYNRVLTDALYPLPRKDLPQLSEFYTPAALRAKEKIERYFQNRPGDQARYVSMYVLDLGQATSERLQRNILGMQGAELIKQRRSNFTLAISNGRMARNVLLAPNLARGDIEDVTVMPLTLGRSQSDATAATTIINNFVYTHADYGVRRLDLKDEKRRIAVRARSIDLAFMGVGTVEPEDQKSLFWRLLQEKGLDPVELKSRGVIGNVLFQFVLEGPDGLSWERDERPDGKRIAVDFDDPSDDEELHAVSLHVLRELVEVGEAQIFLLAKEPTRASIVRAALEMRWANAVICTLTVAEELSRLLVQK